MQLFTAVLVLAAADAAFAADAFIPYDCYTESVRLYGAPKGQKITDKELIAGLDINNSKLTAIAACTDMNTRLISGVTTTWGVWDGDANQWSDVKAMNTIGNMSGLQEYDDSSAASTAGVSLNQAANWALQAYWYQEASPDQKIFYANRKDNYAADSDVAEAATKTRQNAFAAADTDNDELLTFDEAMKFYEVVRPLDGKDGATDVKIEKIERAFKVAANFNEPYDKMSFADYEGLEKLMEAAYAEGKLEKTGHARGDNPGEDLSHHCTTIKMEDANDDLVYFYMESGQQGVTQISLQTTTQPLKELGNPDPSRYAYQNTNWETFTNGRNFYGLWGWADEETNNMNALGFIVHDSVCTDDIKNKLNDPESYSWISTYDPQTKAELDQEYKDYLASKKEVVKPTEGTIIPTEEPTGDLEEGHEGHDHGDVSVLIPTHEHDSETESGLVVVCVLIWVAVLILIIVFFYQYCKEKKGNSAIAYEVQ